MSSTTKKVLISIAVCTLVFSAVMILIVGRQVHVEVETVEEEDYRYAFNVNTNIPDSLILKVSIKDSFGAEVPIETANPLDTESISAKRLLLGKADAYSRELGYKYYYAKKDGRSLYFRLHNDDELAKETQSFVLDQNKLFKEDERACLTVLCKSHGQCIVIVELLVLLLPIVVLVSISMDD